MTVPIVPIIRAVSAARAARAAVRGYRGSRAGRNEPENRRRGRAGRGRVGRSRGSEDGGAEFTSFESTATQAAERGIQAMFEMAGSRGQLAILQDVAPKFTRYAEHLARTGSRPSWSAVRNMTNRREAVEDILNEGFEYLVDAYKDDIIRQGIAATHDEGEDEESEEDR